MKKYHAWQPITNPKDLKFLGKLSEESGELTQAIGRCIIQGLNEHEPKSKKSNRRWLEEEIADVLINIELVRHRFRLDRTFIKERMKIKRPKLRWWHGQL